MPTNTPQSKEESAEPSGGAGSSRRPMSPQERARHAALVRWGKKNPLAARLMALREKKKAKTGGKGKGAKPKETPDQNEQERQQNLAKVKQTMADTDQGLGPAGFDNLIALADGKEPGDVGADALIQMGMAERGKDGVLRLTASGRTTINAAGRGDAKGAIDAVSRGADRAATQREREQAKQQKEQERQGKGGGGGGGGKKEETDDEKNAKKEQERTKNRVDTAKQVGLNTDDAEALRQSADEGGADNAKLRALGLVDENGDATDQGRRALSALERGDARGYRAAVQDAKARMQREQGRATRKREREAERGGRKPGAGEPGGVAGPRGDTGEGEDKEETPEERRQRKERERERERSAQQAESRAKVGKQAGLGESLTEALNEFASPDENIALAPQNAEKLEASGLIERDTDGNYRMTDAGREYVRASNGGNVRAAADALSRGKDRRKQADDRKRREQERVAQRERQAGDAAARMHRGERMTDTQIRQLLDVGYAERTPDGSGLRLTDAGRRAAQATKAIDMDDDLIELLENLEDSTDAVLDMVEPEAKAGRVLSAVNAERVMDTMEMLDRAVARLYGLLESAGLLDEGEAEEEQDAPMGGPVGILDEAKSVEPSYAVKALDDTGDRIGGYAIIFGNESFPDLSPYKDFFTPETDFWLDAFKTRPMLYHHAMEERTAADPVVGVWDTARVDEIGVWLEGELKKRHTYKQAIKDLIARGALGQSSDSAPHLVKRRWMPNGTHKVVRWPLLASSLTPTPAEPRMIETSLLKEAYKAVGIDWPVHIDDASIASTEGADGTKAQSADERARRLNTLIHILELEATTYG